MKWMKTTNWIVRLSLLVSLAVISGCGSNIFVNFADTTEDDALLFEAKQSLDKSDFNGAINFIELMSTAGQSTDEALSVKASAFAGRCGFGFLSFVESIGSTTGGRFFQILMTTMTAGTTTKRDDCVAATDLLNQIGDATARSDDENMLMALVSLAAMGTIFNTFVDTDNDDAVDATFNHCSTIDDTNMTRVVVNMADTLTSLSAIGSSSSVAGGEMDSLTSACADLAAVDANLDFCSVTDPADVTSDHILGMRGVVGSDESIGLGNSVQAGCGAGNTITECVAACP